MEARFRETNPAKISNHRARRRIGICSRSHVQDNYPSLTQLKSDGEGISTPSEAVADENVVVDQAILIDRFGDRQLQRIEATSSSWHARTDLLEDHRKNRSLAFLGDINGSARQSWYFQRAGHREEDFTALVNSAPPESDARRGAIENRVPRCGRIAMFRSRPEIGLEDGAQVFLP
jgi:hypothetical protein